ncbi:hypothetical protein AAC387_Pa02g3422 [Persea americana]
MAVSGSLQFSHEFGICKLHGVCGHFTQYKSTSGNHQVHLSRLPLSSHALRQGAWSLRLSDTIHRPIRPLPSRHSVFTCRSFFVPGQPNETPILKVTASALERSYNALRGTPVVLQLVPAIGIIAFAVWGLGPLVRHIRNLFLHRNDNNWKKSRSYHIMASYVQPMLLWTGATLICRVLDPVILPSEASQAVKQRLLSFIRSLSTVLAFAYCLSSFIQQAQKFFMETNDTNDARNMGFQFAGKAVYTAVWVAAVSLFMELLGFSTQKWLTAGGLGTVLLTLAGREIFTNFLSSIMIHATRPFIVNEWVQTKIEGYEVSGTVEHVGWWSPTVIRGENREAIHIPNHKFSVNVVRNLSQKTHWRIKTHLAISHMDANKINNIVADMRKVLAKNPQVEQQRLHRRVFLDNIDPENQALLILVSCFVKTSHFEEYLCVKEAILLDLLRVISHHRARLATPIRTVQKIYGDADVENIPFAETIFSHPEAGTNRRFLLVEPPSRINGDDKAKTRATRANEVQDAKAAASSSDSKATDPVSDNSVQNVSDNKQSKKTNSGDARSKSGNSGSVSTAVSTLAQPFKPHVDGMDSGVLNSKENTLGAASEKSPSLSVESNGEKAATPPPVPKAALEENIVLGVALEGSKRTLPIDDKAKAHATRANEVQDAMAATSPSDSKATGPVSDNSVQNGSDNKQSKKTNSGDARSKSGNSGAVSTAVSMSAQPSKPHVDGMASNVLNSKDNTLGTASEKSPALSVESSGEKAATPPPVPKAALEENIVLGVALEGSKRILPIDEGISPSRTPAEVKETRLNGSLSMAAGKDRKDRKDRKDNQVSSVPGSASSDKRDQDR